MRFRLVTLDLDGTLLPRDMSFAAILRANGHQALAEEASRKFADGTWDLPTCYARQWDVVRTLELQAMHRALRQAAWLPGIADGVAALQAEGARVCLLTDVASTVTDFLGRWGLTDAICSPVTVKDGRQVALDRRLDKLANLRARLRDWGMGEAEVCHVGNGENDVPVFDAVEGSVAVFAHPKVAQRAKTSIAAPASMGEVGKAVLELGRSSR